MDTLKCECTEKGKDTMNRKDDAKAEVMNFKDGCKFHAERMGEPTSVWDWNDHDEEMFERFWERNVVGQEDNFIQASDCSWADCTHFYFDFKDKLVDFVIEDDDQTDIWRHAYILDKSTRTHI